MLRVGLTGGIGSGKTTVAALLAERGAVVIDADQVAREVVAPGSPGLAAVAAQFGPAVLSPAGSLDRAALGRVVFADEERRQALSAIVHPLIADRTRELMDAAPDGSVVVHDVPLLVENGLAGAYDVVVVVDAPDEVREQRLVQGRGMTADEVRGRMAAQAGREERLAVADVVVDNAGSAGATREQVARLWSRLAGQAAAEPRPSAQPGPYLSGADPGV